MACGDGQIGERRFGSAPDEDSYAPLDGFEDPDGGVPYVTLPSPSVEDESPKVPTKAGNWPSPSEPLGHRHAECEATYGMSPEEIEATPCGISGGEVPDGSSYAACTHTGALDFQGSNISFDCVNWATGSTEFGTRCEGAPGCENVVFRRTTITGSNGNAVQNLILLTSRGGQPLRSVLIEQSDISRSDVAILCGSAANGDLYPLPGEGDKALVIRDSRIHGTAQSPTAHTDLMFIAEGCRGVLSERNLWDGSDALRGANVGSVIQDQPGNSTGGNHVFRHNRFVHDGSGHMFNFDRNAGSSTDACADPVIFESNLFDWKFDLSDGYADTLFNTSTTGKECPRIESRAGSSCTGNQLANGVKASCSSDGT